MWTEGAFGASEDPWNDPEVWLGYRLEPRTAQLICFTMSNKLLWASTLANIPKPLVHCLTSRPVTERTAANCFGDRMGRDVNVRHRIINNFSSFAVHKGIYLWKEHEERGK